MSDNGSTTILFVYLFIYRNQSRIAVYIAQQYALTRILINDAVVCSFFADQRYIYRDKMALTEPYLPAMAELSTSENRLCQYLSYLVPPMVAD